MRAELEKPTSRELDLKYYGEQEIQKTYNVNGLFSKKMAREVTEELEKLADRVENSRLIEGLFENF